MEDIDWESSPEGTTHQNQFNRGWIKHFGNGSYQYWNGHSWEMGFGCMDNRYVQKPKSKTQNIPVGSPCEWLSEFGWLGGKVVGYDGGVTIVRHNDGYEGCHLGEVRLIKTPEQIKAEELHTGVQRIMDDAGITDSAFKDDPEAWVWATALYNKGYKLQEDK